jgi:hypothetical protein
MSWEGYPQRDQSATLLVYAEDTNTTVGDDTFPHFKADGCMPCGLSEALKGNLYKLAMPRWFYPHVPGSMEELKNYCAPCTITAIKDAWASIGTVRSFPHFDIQWNAVNLPPRGIHNFYFDPLFDTRNPILISLARWSRDGASSKQESRSRRGSLSEDEKQELIAVGWLGPEDFE